MLCGSILAVQESYICDSSLPPTQHPSAAAAPGGLGLRGADGAAVHVNPAFTARHALVLVEPRQHARSDVRYGLGDPHVHLRRRLEVRDLVPERFEKGKGSSTSRVVGRGAWSSGGGLGYVARKRCGEELTAQLGPRPPRW